MSNIYITQQFKSSGAIRILFDKIIAKEVLTNFIKVYRFVQKMRSEEINIQVDI